jgi:hypothetical protein
MINPWDKIFLDDFEAAYQIADRNYSISSESFDLRARATSLLLLRNYDKALTDFLTLEEIEKNTNTVGDGTYLNIALCYYAMGDDETALEFFKFPVTNRKEVKYTNDISVPGCVLFYIAVKLNRQDILKIAIKELKKRKLTIPLFLLGTVSMSQLNEIYEQETQETLRNRKECKAEFYKAVAALQNNNPDQYKQRLQCCVDLKGKYLEFEYYMAKVELDKLL